MLTLLPKSESQAKSLFPASFTANSLKSSLPISSVPLRETHYSPPSLAALCRDHQNTWRSFPAPWFLLLFNPPNTARESFQNANHDVISFRNFPRRLGWDGVMIPQLGSQGHHLPVLPAGQGCSVSTLHLELNVSAILSFQSWNEASGPSDMLFPGPGTLLPMPPSPSPSCLLIVCLKVTFSRKLFLIPKID